MLTNLFCSSLATANIQQCKKLPTPHTDKSLGDKCNGHIGGRLPLLSRNGITTGLSYLAVNSFSIKKTKSRRDTDATSLRDFIFLRTHSMRPYSPFRGLGGLVYSP